MGKHMTSAGTLHGFKAEIFSLLLSIGVGVVASYVIIALLDWYRDRALLAVEAAFNWKVFLRDWAIIFLCWIPIWLAAYPGFFCYDQSGIYDMYLAGEITAKHSPLLYFIIGFFIDCFYKMSGDYNLGIAVYVVLQMLVVSCCHAYLLSFVRSRLSGRKVLCAILLLYYALFPVISMFGACTTKDVLFSAFAEVVVILVCKILDSPETNLGFGSVALCFLLVASLMLLCRRNGIYAYALAIPFAVFFCRSKRIFATLLFVAVLCINVFIVSFVYPLCHVKADKGLDMYCIPIQQLARAYNYDNEVFTAEQKELMNKVFNEHSLNNYCPVSADNAKYKFKTSKYLKNKAEYQNLWLSIGKKAPITYIDAFLMNTLYAWYPDSVIDGYQQLGDAWGWGHMYSETETSYFSCDVESPGTFDSKLPWLYDRLFYISRYVSFQKIPVLSWLFSVGAMNWLLLFVVAYLIYKKEFDKLGSLIYPVLLVATVLFGPMVLVRYYLVNFYLMAFLVMCLVTPGRKGTQIRYK